jgi:eukaryotic-like serine/threonine-protein kinase
MKGSPLDVRATEEMSATTPDWEGTARYEVRGRLGTGGMGAVYEAFDRERRQLVAVKTLLRFSPTALYRFKQEFRTLADVIHPNLVHLHELVATGAGQVFFAMELVRGTDFVTHVLHAARSDARMPGVSGTQSSRGSSSRPPTARLSVPPLAAVSADADITGPFDAAAPRPPRPPPTGPSPADVPRLRAALRQLVAGIGALHAAGRLHRDIKPSNVLVTPEGRVVLLDFGVATDLSRILQESSREHEIVGTARYMAPEQATDGVPSVASDWYSVGVVLYEALVGRPPFTGPSIEVLTRKNVLDAPAPSESVTDVPADLDTLCCALLRRDPESRPSGEEIARWLDGPPMRPRRSQSMRPAPRTGHPVEAPLLGRDAEMLALVDAFDTALLGRKLVTVRVHGNAGVGKTALLQHFLAQITSPSELTAPGEGVTVLRGRAYERESMPYKALDSVVDALSRCLMRIGEHDATTGLPRDIGALAQLFPVLSRIRRVNEAPAPPAGAGPMAVRRHAIGALRQLLGQLAATQPLVVCIDDVQWGDVDSAGLLLELVRLPFGAPVLLLLGYREAEGDSSPFLAETRTRWPPQTDVRDVALGPLAPEDARALAMVFLAPGDEFARETAESIAYEAGGNPLLVEELSRSVAQPGTAGGPSRTASRAVVRLESVVEARISALPADARRLLELVAVSARPLPVTIVGDAAGVYERLDDTIVALRERRFVRTGFRDGREVVEMLHDRVRETLVAHLSEGTLREHHGRLARVLEPVPGVDTEALAVHLLGAGETARAAKYAERAAEQAAAKLAFGQAIRLYKLEIEMLGDGSADARRVRVRLAEVLERAARGVEAAHAYLAAAARARGFERVELEREAAEQLLLTGHLDEGEAALDRILAAAGMRRPATLFVALLSLLFYRMALAFRGSRMNERDARDVRRVDHLRIEAIHAVVLGLSFVNVVYGVLLQPRHLYLALRAGDRFQVLRAAGIEALHAAARGGPVGRREAMFADMVARMAPKIDEADARAYHEVDARAYHEGTSAIRLFMHGRWREAGDGLADALERYATTPAGWHSNAELFAIYCLLMRGQLNELRLQHAARLAEAEERGDLYTTVNLRIGHTNTVWLVADDVAAARRHVRQAMAAWPERGFSLQRYRAKVAEANIELYAGAGPAAYDLVARQWGALRRSFLMRIQYLRGDAYFLRARCAVASSRVDEAARFARKLDAERMPWTSVLASLVWAGVAGGRGDRASAVAHLRVAIERAEEVDMRLHAEVARLRLGALLGSGAREGVEGAALSERARGWMADQGVVRPERIAAMLAPLAQGME